MRHTPCGCAPYGVLLLNSKARISESKVLVLTAYYERERGACVSWGGGRREAAKAYFLRRRR